MHLLYLLFSWLLALPAPSGRHARTASQTRTDAPERRISNYPEFCAVAERHAERWPEIRHLGGPLPYAAADRPNGITVDSDDLDLFDTALGAAPIYQRTRIVPAYYEAYERERDMAALRSELTPLVRQALAIRERAGR